MIYCNTMTKIFGSLSISCYMMLPQPCKLRTSYSTWQVVCLPQTYPYNIWKSVLMNLKLTKTHRHVDRFSNSCLLLLVDLLILIWRTQQGCSPAESKLKARPFHSTWLCAACKICRGSKHKGGKILEISLVGTSH